MKRLITSLLCLIVLATIAVFVSNDVLATDPQKETSSKTSSSQTDFASQLSGPTGACNIQASPRSASIPASGGYITVTYSFTANEGCGVTFGVIQNGGARVISSKQTPSGCGIGSGVTCTLVITSYVEPLPPDVASRSWSIHMFAPADGGVFGAAAQDASTEELNITPPSEFRNPEKNPKRPRFDFRPKCAPFNGYCGTAGGGVTG